MEKDFDGWNTIKQKLDKVVKPPFFNEREVWWCSIGMNIGYELFGKDAKFWRPVLVLSKQNKHTFFGLPLSSTQRNDNPYYLPLYFHDREGSIILSQGRTFSSKRLSHLIGTLPQDKFVEVKKAFKALF